MVRVGVGGGGASGGLCEVQYRAGQGGVRGPGDWAGHMPAVRGRGGQSADAGLLRRPQARASKE